MNKKYKYTIRDIFPPTFSTINGQRYLFPGWIPVSKSVTLDDVLHINPYRNLQKREIEVTGSKGAKYIVTVSETSTGGHNVTCNCPAGKFRGKCKHATKIKEQLIKTK